MAFSKFFWDLTVNEFIFSPRSSHSLQDFKKALDDFLQASDEGHADAAVSAGAMLHNGVGVLKDQRKAFELYQLAGELGSEEG
jgi:TPR repeat protein